MDEDESFKEAKRNSSLLPHQSFWVSVIIASSKLIPSSVISFGNATFPRGEGYNASIFPIPGCKNSAERKNKKVREACDVTFLTVIKLLLKLNKEVETRHFCRVSFLYGLILEVVLNHIDDGLIGSDIVVVFAADVGNGSVKL